MSSVIDKKKPIKLQQYLTDVSNTEKDLQFLHTSLIKENDVELKKIQSALGKTINDLRNLQKLMEQQRSKLGKSLHVSNNKIQKQIEQHKKKEFKHLKNKKANILLQIANRIFCFFEDQYDYYSTERAYKKWKAGGMKTYTLEEMMKKHVQN